jgi:hypothetical protein
MCFKCSNIVGIDKYNWDGDIIVHDCTIQASRAIPDYIDKKYTIDIREFILSEKNMVMKRTINNDIRKMLQSINPYYWELFNSNSKTSFDYRALTIKNFVSKYITYNLKSNYEPWLMPDETIAVKEGDCEDRAFLIASLMIASGISPFNVRVAIGQVNLHYNDRKKESYNHVWVMYKTEIGKWILIEPLVIRHDNKLKIKIKDRSKFNNYLLNTEYVPFYLLNDHHLWAVFNEKNPYFDYKKFSIIQNRLKKFNPSFAGYIHENIMTKALSGAPESIIAWISSRFLFNSISESTTIAIEDSPLGYKPEMHFDNCYIKEGWDWVNKNLEKYHETDANNNQDLNYFGVAAHAVADFYAHTSYANFSGSTQYSDPNGNNIDVLPIPQLYDGTQSDAVFNTGNFDLTGKKFTVNKKLFKGSKSQIPGIWNGQIISGRYAQPETINYKRLFSDPMYAVEQGIDFPDDLLSDQNFFKRAAVPHHDEIAVDEIKKSASHKLYNGDIYTQQFKLRERTAILHIRELFNTYYNGGKLPDLTVDMLD